MGGTIGLWLITRQLSLGFSISQTHDVALTALDIGILAGALVGITTATPHRGASTQDRERGRVRAESTWTNRPEPDPILVEIITQIAELEGVDPLELEPLCEHINPDALSDIRDGRDWRVLFCTDKYEIRVSGQGTVTVYDLPGDHSEATMPHSIQEIQ